MEKADHEVSDCRHLWLLNFATSFSLSRLEDQFVPRGFSLTRSWNVCPLPLESGISKKTRSTPPLPRTGAFGSS